MSKLPMLEHFIYEQNNLSSESETFDEDYLEIQKRLAQYVIDNVSDLDLSVGEFGSIDYNNEDIYLWLNSEMEIEVKNYNNGLLYEYYELKELNEKNLLDAINAIRLHSMNIDNFSMFEVISI